MFFLSSLNLKCRELRGCLVFLFGILLLTTASAQSRGPMSERHRSPDATVAVSPDGFTVAVARSSGGAAKRFGRVDLWDTRSGELLRTINGFDGPIWSMTFSKDGRSLLTVSTEFRDSKIQVSVKERQETDFAELKWWDVQSGEFVKKLPLGEEGITSVEGTWSPDGNVFALIERYVKRQLTQISLPGLNPQVSVPGYEMIEEVDLKLLDAQTGQRKVKVEDVDKTFYGRLIWLFGRLAEPVFSPDGKTLAAIF